MPATATGQLTAVYGEMTSLDRVWRALERDGVDVEHLHARDLYKRDLDYQNLGGTAMLEVIAAAAAQRGGLPTGRPGARRGLRHGRPGPVPRRAL